MALTQPDVLLICARYEEQRLAFERLASAAHETLAEVLAGLHVRHMVAHRAKGVSSLHRKLWKAREKYGREQFTEALSPPVKDLAAARVLLYLAEDLDPVVAAIKARFASAGHNVTYDHVVPGSGYDAHHFHVDCHGDAFQRGELGPDTLFEVQVCTITQHVWNELEHDIIYKQPSGKPDAAQVELLAALHGELGLAAGTASRLMRHTGALIAKNTETIVDPDMLQFYLRSRVDGRFLHGDFTSLFEFLAAVMDPFNNAALHDRFVSGLSESAARELLQKHDTYGSFRDAGCIAIQLLPNFSYRHIEGLVTSRNDPPPLFKFILQLAAVVHKIEGKT